VRQLTHDIIPIISRLQKQFWRVTQHTPDLISLLRILQTTPEPVLTGPKGLLNSNRIVGSSAETGSSALISQSATADVIAEGCPPVHVPSKPGRDLNASTIVPSRSV